MNIECEARDIKFALDIGTRSVIGAIGIVKNGKLNIISEAYIEHDERAMIDGQIHDIGLVSKAVKSVVNELQEKNNVKLEKVTIAAAGRFLKTINSSAEVEISKDEVITKDWIKTLELKAVKEAEKNVIEEIDSDLYCVGYSVKNYYLNGYVISNLNGHKGENIGADIIATFLPKSVVDSLYSVMEKCGLKANSLTLEPIAAIEAVVPQKLRLLNIALVDIGAGTSDIAISAEQSISAYGMVPMAGDEVTEEIAKECLVDFNKAEEIKKQLVENEEVVFEDILGFEVTKKSADLKSVIAPIVEKLGQTIGEKIIELNGGKSPSAIFVVGGGAHTPGVLEEIAKYSEIPPQRIAIKDRQAVEDCIVENNFGSAGVTVLGIGLIGVKNEGNDLVNVYLNHVPISLFNSHEHIVGDVLVHADIDPSMLMAKRGKNLRYTLNGVKKISFGAKGENAKIKINEVEASIESKVSDGDEISIIYAKAGEDGKADVLELLKEYEAIDIYVNGELITLEPIVFINGLKVELNSSIREGDNIEIIYPETIGQLKKYILNTDEEIYINELSANDEYILKAGDKIEAPVEQAIYESAEEKTYLDQYKKDVADDEVDKRVQNIIKSLVDEDKSEIIDTVDETDVEKENKEIDIESNENIGLEEEAKFIEVIVNDKKLVIPDMKETMFVQIFNYIDFDLSEPKGNIILELNGKTAGYTDIIKSGDTIKIYWA